MAVFNSAVFYSGVYFTDAGTEVVKTGTGGIDPSRKRRTIYKPTGLLAKRSIKEVIEQRVQETRETHEEIKEEIALSFREERPTVEMTMAEVDKEIGVLLRKKLQQDEDDMMLLIAILND